MQSHCKEMSVNPKGGIPVEQDHAVRIKEMEISAQEWAYIRQAGYELASRNVDGLPLLSEEELAELIKKEQTRFSEQDVLISEWEYEQGDEG